MNTNFAKIKDFINKYKFLLIPIIPLLFFITLLIMLPSLNNPGSNQKNETITQPTSIPVQNNTVVQFPTPTTGVIAESLEEESLDDREGLIKKETLPNGLLKYTFTSPNPARPDIYYAQSATEVFFERDIILPDYPVKITDFTVPYGEPERIIQAPAFYSSNFKTYIYAREGYAFIGNPQTNQVVEQHIFPPVSTEEYIEKYSRE